MDVECSAWSNCLYKIRSALFGSEKGSEYCQGFPFYVNMFRICGVLYCTMACIYMTRDDGFHEACWHQAYIGSRFVSLPRFVIGCSVWYK
jgi:hypothetical protein